MSEAGTSDTAGTFDKAAAITRSLLGWGVVAGPFYLVVGLTLALTRSGFDVARHPLSLLMLGEGGWMQTANLILTGIMVLAAALGFRRAADRGGAGLWLGVAGIGLVGSGLFPPDPMGGFPAGVAEVGTTSGIMHLVFGLVQFVGVAVAAILAGGWFARRGASRTALYSRLSGAVVLLGFFGGAALSTASAGVAALWLAVVVEWVWLAVASVQAYRTVPHPDGERRTAAA
ncbi:DUF998 domain-containing protein [Actinomycetes bacterium KLBMP 9759]